MSKCESEQELRPKDANTSQIEFVAESVPATFVWSGDVDAEGGPAAQDDGEAAGIEDVNRSTTIWLRNPSSRGVVEDTW